MRLLLLALLPLIAVPVLAAADDCPPAHFASTSIPAHDFYASSVDTGLVGGAESLTVHYKWGVDVGEAFLRRVSALGSGGSSLDIVDDFTVGRVPNGTPVSFDAILSAYGNAPPAAPSGPAWTVTLGTDQDSVSGGNVYTNWSQDLTLPLNVIAGTPFRLHFRMQIFGGFDSLVQNEGASIRFEGFPPGAIVFSCHGFLAGSLPTEPTTWGSLKARYH